MIWGNDEQDIARSWILELLPEEIAFRMKDGNEETDAFETLFPRPADLDQLVRERRSPGSAGAIEELFSSDDCSTAVPARPEQVLAVFEIGEKRNRQAWFLDLLEEAALRVFTPDSLRQAASGTCQEQAPEDNMAKAAERESAAEDLWDDTLEDDILEDVELEEIPF